MLRLCFAANPTDQCCVAFSQRQMEKELQSCSYKPPGMPARLVSHMSTVHLSIPCVVHVRCQLLIYLLDCYYAE